MKTQGHGAVSKDRDSSTAELRGPEIGRKMSSKQQADEFNPGRGEECQQHTGECSEMNEKISNKVERARNGEEKKKTNKKRDIFLMNRNIGNENSNNIKKNSVNIINKLDQVGKKHIRDRE